VGYYCANERFDNYDLGSLAKNIGDQIAKHCPQSAILLVFFLVPYSLLNVLVEVEASLASEIFILLYVAINTNKKDVEFYLQFIRKSLRYVCVHPAKGLLMFIDSFLAWVTLMHIT
jgi:hypothetical protein